MLPDAAVEPIPFGRHCHCRSWVAARMCARNDITLVQRWICRRRGKEEQDDYLSRIDLGPDNDVADVVSHLEEAGYELEKNSRGDYVLVKSDWRRGASKAGGGGKMKRASTIARTFDSLQPPPPLSVPRGGKSRTSPSHSVPHVFALRRRTPKPSPIAVAAAAARCIPSLLMHLNFTFDGGGGGGV